MIIGHSTTRLVLERELPPVTLLVGPASIGKFTLVRHLIEQHRVNPVDRMAAGDGLTVDLARSISDFARRAPHGRLKTIAVDLDGATRPALNALLKTLEEPPERVKFLMTSSRPLLPTVASRCTLFRLGLLTVAEVTKVLIGLGLTPGRAEQAARQARGQVAVGLAADQGNETARLVVLDVARAIATADRELFNRAFIAWDENCNALLSTWITESLTGRYLMFGEPDFYGLHQHRDRLLDIAAAMTRLPAARPRLGVRAALEPFTVRS